MAPRQARKAPRIGACAVEVLQREGADAREPPRRRAPRIGGDAAHHFTSRAGIVECALEEPADRAGVFVLSRSRGRAHPIDQLAQVRRCKNTTGAGRIVFLSQAIATSSSARMEQIIDVGNRVFEPYRRAAADRIRKGIEEGLVAPCDPEALMAIVRAVIDGLMVQRVMTGLDLAPAHEFLWTHVLRPLKRERTTEKKR
jgi:hypothetical protein